jgi:hypothetical protein
MGLALDLQSFFTTAAGAGAAAAAVTGDTLSIRNARPGSDILGVGMWTKDQGVGTTTMLVTSGHDFVRNFRYRNAVNLPDSKVPARFPLHFKPQDALTINQVGSATAGDLALIHMLNWYEDLPGVEANLINNAELRQRGVQLLTVEDTLTSTATGYSGQRAINAAADLYKADTEYAILGATFGVVAGALAIQAVDFGNLHVGIPVCPASEWETKDWFSNLSERMDIPCIPVFNSANRNNVLLTIVQDENNTAVPLNLILAQLAPRSAKAMAKQAEGNTPSA